MLSTQLDFFPEFPAGVIITEGLNVEGCHLADVYESEEQARAVVRTIGDVDWSLLTPEQRDIARANSAELAK